MAQTVYLKLKINGNDIDGESTVHSLDRENTIECSSYNYGVEHPQSTTSIRPAGRRLLTKLKHKPIIITKRIDQTSPLLAKALCNNEIVTEAQFLFFRPDVEGSGAEEHFYTVTIEHGYITEINQLSEDATMGDVNGPMMEEISFVFKKITWTYMQNGATHTNEIGR